MKTNEQIIKEVLKTIKVFKTRIDLEYSYYESDVKKLMRKALSMKEPEILKPNTYYKGTKKGWKEYEI